METKPTTTTLSRRAKIALAVGGGIMIFMLGASSASPSETNTVTAEPKVVTKEVTKPVTPQACIDVIDLDNQMFTRIGQSLGELTEISLLDTAVYVRDNTPRRTQLIHECRGV